MWLWLLPLVQWGLGMRTNRLSLCALWVQRAHTTQADMKFTYMSVLFATAPANFVLRTTFRMAGSGSARLRLTRSGWWLWLERNGEANDTLHTAKRSTRTNRTKKKKTKDETKGNRKRKELTMSIRASMRAIFNEKNGTRRTTHTHVCTRLLWNWWEKSSSDAHVSDVHCIQHPHTHTDDESLLPDSTLLQVTWCWALELWSIECLFAFAVLKIKLFCGSDCIVFYSAEDRCRAASAASTNRQKWRLWNGCNSIILISLFRWTFIHQPRDT